jgi:O-antigen ligase
MNQITNRPADLAMGLGIFCAFAIGLSSHGWFGIISFGLILVSIYYLLRYRPLLALSKYERSYVWASVLFPAAILVNMYAHDNTTWQYFDNPSRLILVLPVFFAVRASSVKIDFLHWGIVVGAIVLGATAIYQRHELGIGRVYGNISNLNFPITFGNISLTLGILSLLCTSTVKARLGWLAYLVIVLACGLGVYGSLLSGTRGGWISLPFLVVILLGMLEDVSIRKKWLIAISLLFIFILVVMLEPSVARRVTTAWNEIHSIVFEGTMTNFSVGLRLQMWYVAFHGFLQSPMLGLGLGSYWEFKEAFVEQNGLFKHTIAFQYAHSEPLHYLSVLGLVGFIPLMAFYISGFALVFSKRKQARQLAGMLLLIAVFRFDIGLTQVQFIYHITTLFYAMLFAIVAGYMCRPVPELET